MHTATRRRPVLLVGAGTREIHLHTFLQIVAEHPVVLVDHPIPLWARPYLTGEITAALACPDEVATAVAEFTASRPVGGVIAYDQRRAVLAARMAQQLGLPGNAPQTMDACRNPAWTCRLLQDHGVPAVPSAAVHDEDNAVEAARAVRGPVSLTATAAGGTLIRADGDDEVRTAYRTLSQASAGEPFVAPVTVEEFGLDGPEIGVEAVVVSPQEIQIIAVTRSDIRPELATSPFGHSVDGADELLQDDALRELIGRALAVLGLSVGVVQVQVRLTRSGPHVVQISPGLADDLVPLLVARATGIDLARTAARLATGAFPDMLPTRQKAAAVRFLYPHASGELARITPPGPALESQHWVDRFIPMRETGGTVLGPPRCGAQDRLAYWVVTGEDAAQCTVQLDAVAEHVSARIRRPVPSPVGAP
ncbi:ATP-grasp domain-containing protein [Streptomyces sp. NPDC002845]